MPVMDEFKEEREAIKKQGAKARISYFFYYYKWHVLSIAFVLIAVTSLTIQIVTRKDNAIYVCLLNASERSVSLDSYEMTSGAEHGALFAAYAGIDTNKYDVYIDTSMHIDYSQTSDDTMVSAQKFVAHLAAGELDVMLTDEASIENYSYQEDFYDLRTLLSAEELSKYEPYFYYIDLSYVEKRNAILNDPKNLYTDSVLPAPSNPRDPSSMEQPIPVGIYIDNNSLVEDYFYFKNEGRVAAIFANTKHIDTALQYLSFLMNQNPA